MRPLLLLLLLALAAASPAAAREVDGGRLYGRDCAWCHGGGGQGSNNGPGLVGVGAASAHFYLTTGRMPIERPRVSTRGDPAYSPEEIDALVDVVRGFGDGPGIPEVDPAAGDAARGGELYRLHCAACHGFSGFGGALAASRNVPAVWDSTPTQVAEAMLIDLPQMPVFSPRPFDEQQVNDVLAYVQVLQRGSVAYRGGHDLWRVGPVAEGLVAVLLGFGVLFGVARLLGERA